MPTDMKNPHEEHRKRMRDKYLLAKEAMPDHELLEILLFSAIPRKNTNPIAHALLNRFGSLEGVFSANISSLIEVEGIGEQTAFFLSQLLYLYKRMELNKHTGTILDSHDKIADYFDMLFLGELTESVYTLLLDSNSKLLACKKLFEGTVSTSSVNARKIVDFAVAHQASRVILGHNHLSGNTEPSDEDITASRYLRRVLYNIDLMLEEHFIIGAETYCPIFSYIEDIMKERTY